MGIQSGLTKSTEDPSTPLNTTHPQVPPTQAYLKLISSNEGET